LSDAEIEAGVMETIRKFVGRMCQNVPDPVNVQVAFNNPKLRGISF